MRGMDGGLLPMVDESHPALICLDVTMKQSALRTKRLKLWAAVLQAAILCLSASSGTGARTVAGVLALPQAAGATTTVGTAAQVTRFEESAARLMVEGDWFGMDSATAGVELSGGLAVYSRVNGSTATFGFRGTGVKWIGLPCETCGIAEVYVDGAYADTIDTFGPGRPGPPATMFAISDLPAGSHTLTIQVAGRWSSSSSGADVFVDAFDVEGLITGTNAPVTRIEEHDLAVTYTGTWWLVMRPDVSGGTCLKGQDPGSRVTFSFNGTGVSFIGFRAEVTGILRIYLDGVYAGDFDTYAPIHLPQQLIYSVANLPAGPHVLTIEVTGNYNRLSCCAWIAIDAFDVISRPPSSGGGGRRKRLL